MLLRVKSLFIQKSSRTKQVQAKAKAMVALATLAMGTIALFPKKIPIEPTNPTNTTATEGDPKA